MVGASIHAASKYFDLYFNLVNTAITFELVNDSTL